MTGRARRQNAFSILCRCSLLGGTIHTVRSRIEYRRIHLPLIRADQLRAIAGTSPVATAPSTDEGEHVMPVRTQEVLSELEELPRRPMIEVPSSDETDHLVSQVPLVSRRRPIRIIEGSNHDAINPSDSSSSSDEFIPHATGSRRLTRVSMSRVDNPTSSSTDSPMGQAIGRAREGNSHIAARLHLRSRRPAITAHQPRAPVLSQPGVHPVHARQGIQHPDQIEPLEGLYNSQRGPREPTEENILEGEVSTESGSQEREWILADLEETPEPVDSGRIRTRARTTDTASVTNPPYLETNACVNNIETNDEDSATHEKRAFHDSQSTNALKAQEEPSQPYIQSPPEKAPQKRIRSCDEAPTPGDSGCEREHGSWPSVEDPPLPEEPVHQYPSAVPSSDSSLSTSSSSDPDSSDSSPSDETGFDYRFPYNTTNSLTQSELQSMALNDIFNTHLIPRQAQIAIIKLFNSLPNVEPFLDSRTATRRIEKHVKVHEVKYDMCPNNCMSYAMYGDTLTHCLFPECLHPRWKDVVSEATTKRIPFATHSYIPLTHRVRLWYAHKERARLLVSYRKEAETKSVWGVTDYWSGKLYNEAKARGIFNQPTDLGFLLSTDGVKVFKSRQSFSIWPIMLVSLNLPPNIRFKKKNLIVVGIIPGPKNPKDIDSFLWPLIEEFLDLERGVPAVWNAATSEIFILRAYIGCVGSDMIGRTKLMGTMGNRATSYCEYCTIKGVYNRGVYCPCNPPVDPPPNAIAKAQKENAWPMPSWDPGKLPLRKDKDFRKLGREILQDGDTVQATETGIKGRSILLKLKSIIFPWSFGPDNMHLWYENVIPKLTRHWRGVFFANTADPDGDDGNLDPSQRRTGRKKSRLSQAEEKDREAAPAGTQPQTAKKQKFRETQDKWNVPPEEWVSISADIVASRGTWPSEFGNPVRSFTENCHHFSAKEWKTWALVEAPIYLEGKLPDYDYEEYLFLVEAIRQTNKNEGLSWGEIDELEKKLLRFYNYYEERYYARKWDQLQACLPTFHQILHVAEAIRWCGPMFVYSQWCMERLCGIIVSTARSRVATNRNLEKTILRQEQKSALAYILPHNQQFLRNTGLRNSSLEEHEDLDGTFLLYSFLAGRLKGSRPPDKPDTFSGIHFQGQSRKPYVFGKHERRRIREFLRKEYPDRKYQIGAVGAMPTECVRWKSAVLESTGKVTSHSMRSDSNTRNSSMIQFEMEGVGFGEVHYFFTLEIEDTSLCLAMIRHWKVSKEDRLLSKDRDGPMGVIHAHCIEMLVGLFKKGSCQYIAGKDSSIFE